MRPGFKTVTPDMEKSSSAFCVGVLRGLFDTATLVAIHDTLQRAVTQAGGRIDHTRFTPIDLPARDFTEFSGALGLLLRPAAADDKFVLALNLAGKPAGTYTVEQLAAIDHPTGDARLTALVRGGLARVDFAGRRHDSRRT